MVEIPFAHSPKNEALRYQVETTAFPGKILNCVEAKEITYGAIYLLRDSKLVRADCIAPAGQLRVNRMDGSGWRKEPAATLNRQVVGRVSAFTDKAT